MVEIIGEEKVSIQIPLSLCIVNGYPKPNREILAEAGVSQAHELYLNFLNRFAPRAKIEVLYAADVDEQLPSGASLTSYDGFIWTGSNLTIYHDNPAVTRQIELCRAIYGAGVPQFGSCWGMQMAAVAAGGEVRKSPNGREWCLAKDITLSEAGRNHPLYMGKQHKFDGFIMHMDEVSRVPEGGKILAANKHTQVQSLAVEYRDSEFWATQYHPEYNLFEMARLLIARRSALVKEEFFTSEQAVKAYVSDLTALSENTEDVILRKKLSMGSDILDPKQRELELRNWFHSLVLPQRASKT